MRFETYYTLIYLLFFVFTQMVTDNQTTDEMSAKRQIVRGSIIYVWLARPPVYYGITHGLKKNAFIKRRLWNLYTEKFIFLVQSKYHFFTYSFVAIMILLLHQHSWVNSAEWIVSIINFNLRKVVNPHLEELFGKTDTLEQIQGIVES